MSHFRIEIRVKPRPGLLDPEGKAIHRALRSLGWDGVDDVRVGKEAMCRKILANPVTEDFSVSVVPELEGAEA